MGVYLMIKWEIRDENEDEDRQTWARHTTFNHGHLWYQVHVLPNNNNPTVDNVTVDNVARLSTK